MAQRGQYEDRFAMEIQNTTISTTVAFADGVDTTSGEEKSGILLNNHPNFPPGQNVIETRKASGSASRKDGTGLEFNQGTREPSFTIEFDVSAKVLYIPLHLLCQRGAVEEDAGGSGPNTKWFFPYSYEVTPSAAEYWGGFVRRLSVSASDSHRVVGAVASSMTLSSEFNSALVCSTEFMARDVENDYRVTASDNFEFTEDATLLWQGATTLIGDGSGVMEAVDLDGFSLTINTNPTRKFYSNQLTQKFLMMDVTAEGTIKVPFTAGTTNFEDNVLLRNFISGTPVRFSIYWGGQYPNANNDLSINFIARITDAPVGQDEDEIVTDVSFQCVEKIFIDSIANGNNNVTSIADSSGTTTITWAASQTALGNVFPGDYALMIDATEAQTKFLIDNVSAIDTYTLTATPSGSPAEVQIFSQPFNIGIDDNLDRSI